MNNSINYEMLLLKAIGIILVVLGHAGGISLANDWFPIYSFHMPLFIFISGYFYNKSNEDNILFFIKKRFYTLLIPYFLWNFFYGLFTNILGILNIVEFSKPLTLWNLFIEPFITGHQFGLNVASWFIPALFLVQTLYILIRKLFSKIKINNESFFLILFFALSIIGVILGLNDFNKSFYLTLTRTLFFICFFQFGYFYKYKLERNDKLKNIYYFLIIFIIQFVIIYKYKNIQFSAVFCNNFNTENIFLPFISSVTGILFWLRISKILIPILKDSKIAILIGSNTFSIMMHHQLVFFILNVFLVVIHKFFFTLPGFSIKAFKISSWYFYPLNGGKFLLFYVFLGLFIPILAKLFYKKFKHKIKSKI